MTPDTLKKIIRWIATHGIDAYCAKTVCRDLDINEAFAIESAYTVVRSILMGALNSAQIETDIEIAKSPDELFDLILTFLERLNNYKAGFQAIFNRSTLSLGYIKLTSVCDEITGMLFKPYIETFFDKLTYNVIMANILYTWLTDETPDLATVSSKINHISTKLFNYS
jgi:hypothetical protein